jgi:dipeptidyl aminopeptidase/acylaminoacyl peptidase
LNCQKNISNPIESGSGELCYQKQDINGQWQIYTNNIYGTNPDDISNNTSNDAYTPRWSPDGNFIAFRYDRTDGEGTYIYLYDINTNELINITPEFTSAESAYPILWSPDSKKLVYHYHKIGEPFYYDIMNVDGAEKQRLLEADSGSLIAFCDQGDALLFQGDQFLSKMNIISKSIETVVDLGGFTNYLLWVDDYDPVSNTILCHEDSSSWGAGICTINLNMMKIDTLVTAKEQTTLLRPVFSNDYEGIAYIERDYENDISKLILLKDGKKVMINQLTTQNLSYGFYKTKFNPNDSYLTYTVIENIPGDWVSFKSYVYVLNIANKEARLIDKGQDSHWNPLNDL